MDPFPYLKQPFVYNFSALVHHVKPLPLVWFVRVEGIKKDPPRINMLFNVSTYLSICYSFCISLLGHCGILLMGIEEYRWGEYKFKSNGTSWIPFHTWNNKSRVQHRFLGPPYKHCLWVEMKEYSKCFHGVHMFLCIFKALEHAFEAPTYPYW